MEYDPNFVNFPEVLDQRYDFVVMNYVLNVLPPKERKRVLKQVHKCLKRSGKAYITVRTIADKAIKGTPEFDGVRTSIGTFQHGYSVKEIEKLLRRWFKKVELIHGSEAARFIVIRATGR